MCIGPTRIARNEESVLEGEDYWALNGYPDVLGPPRRRAGER
jgi:hypothetical protein